MTIVHTIRFIVFTILLYPIVTGCNSKPTFSERLSEQVSHGKGHSILLSELATMDWDSVYIFGPYTSFDDILEKTGYDAQNSSEKTNKVSYISEGECLLLFMKVQKVVREERVRRSIADFSNVLGLYARSQAVFRLQTNGYEKWPYLIKQN
jgi:hypothetical protein